MVKPALSVWDAERRDAIRRRLAENGRVQIADFLAEDYAAFLADEAERETYALTTLDSGSATVPESQLAALAPDLRRQVEEALREAAKSKFTYYAFENVAIHALAERGQGRPVWRELVAFLNGPEVLELMRDLTREPGLDYADAQLTRFGPGHFLATHSDEAEGKKRFYAYVLGLTRTWSIDWGGLLAFHGEDGNVAEAWTPRLNTLNLLKVPQPHSVTLVSPQAQAARLSVTGWYRGR